MKNSPLATYDLGSYPYCTLTPSYVVFCLLPQISLYAVLVKISNRFYTMTDVLLH